METKDTFVELIGNMTILEQGNLTEVALDGDETEELSKLVLIVLDVMNGNITEIEAMKKYKKVKSGILSKEIYNSVLVYLV